VALSIQVVLLYRAGSAGLFVALYLFPEMAVHLLIGRPGGSSSMEGIPGREVLTAWMRKTT
jgi:hypothetical protein